MEININLDMAQCEDLKYVEKRTSNIFCKICLQNFADLI